VLTKTQLRTAKTNELERLQACIQAELDSRIEAELEIRRQQQKLQQQRERGDAKDRIQEPALRERVASIHPVAEKVSLRESSKFAEAL